MAISYLDKAGLTRFWTDFKKYVFTGKGGHLGLVPAPPTNLPATDLAALASNGKWEAANNIDSLDASTYPNRLTMGKTIYAYKHIQTQLYKNATPSSAFAGQQVNISSDDYDLFGMEICWATNNTGKFHTIIARKNVSVNDLVGTNMGGGVFGTGIRPIYKSYNSGKYVRVDDAWFLNSNSTTGAKDNAKFIPLTIIGKRA